MGETLVGLFIGAVYLIAFYVGWYILIIPALEQRRRRILEWHERRREADAREQLVLRWWRGSPLYHPKSTKPATKFNRR